MPPRDTVQYAVFGKLPEEADFVRMGANNHSCVLEFDALLSRSLAYASQQPGWDKARYLRANISEFSFTSHDRRWCYFGALMPSVDKAGRFYPIVAGIILPAHAVLPIVPELTIANELFLVGLQELLPSLRDATDVSCLCQPFFTEQCALNNGMQDEIDLAKQMLSHRLAVTTTLQLQDQLDENALSPLDDILMAFIYQAELTRRLGTNAPRQAIPLPLSGKQGEGALDEAVWLALCRAAAGKNRTADFIIANQYQLILAPNRFNERCLSALWGIPAKPVLDEPPWHSECGWAETAWALGRQLQDPALTLDNLIPSLERISGNSK